MSRLRVESFSVSLDGFGAGLNQDLENPLGVGGMAVHEWFFPTLVFNKMIGKTGGTTGVDNQFASRGFDGIGANIMGRNMFGPIRGPWKDEDWKGWWGPNPPYHSPVFVLTHHKREPLVMEGGTTFYFVTDGIESALKQAQKAAGGKDIRLNGGVSVIRQYLAKGLVDYMHLAVSPKLLGAGENLFAGLDLAKLGYAVKQSVAGENATHVIIEKS
ncbi:dihydrofolate reductase family protein [Bdellovibrio sp. HCB337]|uniref:dihydrofolate reductase family protein n=1 Tax=Bdellovibrio sp. HCB337 TaxID=3394358 RepID=UPI0039A717AB